MIGPAPDPAPLLEQAIVRTVADLGMGAPREFSIRMHDVDGFTPEYLASAGLRFSDEGTSALGGRPAAALALPDRGQVWFSRPMNAPLRALARKHALSRAGRRPLLSFGQADALQKGLHELAHVIYPATGEGSAELWSANLVAPVARRLGIRSPFRSPELSTGYEQLARDERALAARATGLGPHTPQARRWHFTYTAAPATERARLYQEAMAR